MLRGGVRKWCHSASLSLERGVRACCSQGSSFRGVNNFPLCITGIFQFADFHCLWVTCLVEQHSALWAPFQPGLLILKTPNFRDLMWYRPALVFWERVSPPWD